MTNFVYQQTYGYLFARPSNDPDIWISEQVLSLTCFEALHQNDLQLSKIDSIDTIVADVKQLFDVDIKLPQTNTVITSLIINEMSNPNHNSMTKFGWQYVLLCGFIPTIDNNENIVQNIFDVVLKITKKQ